jgi:hypothetical protein
MLPAPAMIDDLGDMNMPKTLIFALAMMMSFGFGATATAGHIFCHWDELADGGGDAGDSLDDFQLPEGFGELNLITGNNDPAVDADLFGFLITGDEMFSATAMVTSTSSDHNEFDTILALFDADGFGVLANDNVTGSQQPTISDAIASGMYLLGIAQAGTKPVDINNNPIFNNDGTVASAFPLDHWAPGSAQGSFDYAIVLTGVVYVPEPSTLTLFVSGLLGLLVYRRRRRQAA